MKKVDKTNRISIKKVDKILFVETMNKYYFPYQNCYFPLKRICKQIVNFDARLNYFTYGKEGMRKRFLDFVKKEQPDWIFLWIREDEFDFTTLLKIREISPKSIVFNVFGDDDATFENFSRYNALFIDYSLTGQPEYLSKYHKDGIRNVFFIIGLDTCFFKPLDIEKKYEVTFIGHPKTPESGRYELIKFLKDNGIKIRLFGWGWDNYPEFREIYGGALDSDEMVRVINQSKIHLCFSKNNSGEPHIVGKFFEGSACRTFVLTEYYKGYKKFFREGKEIVMFKSKEELLKKVRYYLKNEAEREKIASAAYKRINLDYGFDRDLKRISESLPDKNKFHHSSLPKIMKKTVCLTKEDILLPEKELAEKIKNADYISFADKTSNGLPYKDYLQAYSIETTGKPISCCSYYVYSPSLGDYLCFLTEFAFNNLERWEFNSLIKPVQITARKDYFLKNKKDFKDVVLGRHPDIITKENTAMVSIPLARVRDIEKKNYRTMKNAFSFNFLHHLLSIKYQKKLFNIYPFALLAEIISGKRFILEAIIKTLRDKDKWKKMRNILD